MDKLYYSYDDISTLIKDNFNKVKSPDYIIAIGGGGLIPARMLRTYLNKPIYVITVSSYDDEYVKDNIEVLQWVDLDLKDKNILIVDEIDDTRKTLNFCINRLKTKNNANNISVFVLQNKLKNKVNELNNSIEYFACENIEDKWVVYPWD
jgi:uncharacterized protein